MVEALGVLLSSLTGTRFATGLNSPKKPGFFKENCVRSVSWTGRVCCYSAGTAAASHPSSSHVWMARLR